MKLAPPLLATFLIASAPAAAQQEVRFTGHTTADQTLIRDALQQVALHAYATSGCQEIGLVVSSILPDNFEPGAQYRVASHDVTYERWEATLCGNVEPYMIGFWPSAEGGTMFQVSHPFPDSFNDF